MRQRPDGAELKRLADTVLRETPLPDDRRNLSYTQRMALKARSIAGYDEHLEAAAMVEERMLFTALGADMDLGIEALNRRLADEIRTGRWDEAPRELKDLLMHQVRARLERVNPKYLKARLGE